MRHLHTLAGLVYVCFHKVVATLHTSSTLILNIILVGRQYLLETANLCRKMLPLAHASTYIPDIPH